MEKPPVARVYFKASALDENEPAVRPDASTHWGDRLAGAALMVALVTVVPRSARAEVPANASPSVTSSSQPPSTPALLSTVRFVSTDAEASFQRKTGTTTAHLSTFYGFASGRVNSYDEICTDTCELTLPTGSYTFAMARPGLRPVESAPIRLPRGSSNRSSWRFGPPHLKSAQ